jgi:hypothetical protein
MAESMFPVSIIISGYTFVVAGNIHVKAMFAVSQEASIAFFARLKSFISLKVTWQFGDNVFISG